MIYICTHKDFSVPDFTGHKEIFKIVSNAPLSKQYDLPVIYANNRLGSMKKSYCEAYMIYDIYLHEDEDWIGINHYRRYFPSLNLKENTLPQPFCLNMNNHFHTSLNLNDIDEVEKIIDSYYPEYSMHFDKINLWYPCNMFYLNRDMFNKYCQFCFGVLDIFNEKFKLYSDEDVVNHVNATDNKARLHGYLMECLSTIFFIKNFNLYNINHTNIAILKTDEENSFAEIKEALQNTNSKYFKNPNTKYIFFPSDVHTEYVDAGKIVKDWCLANRKENTIDLADFKDQYEYYTNYNLNWHHFTTASHYNMIIPKLDELLNFNYNKDDFKLIPYFDKDPNTGEKFNLTYLWPKVDKNYTIKNDTEEYVGDFGVLMGLHNNNGMTKYHNLFRFPHESCIIINNSENNGRTLLISGDSQNIPELPILAYYFKKIIYLDNRKEHSGIDYNDENITDILFSFFEKFSLTKQLVDNFK